MKKILYLIIAFIFVCCTNEDTLDILDETTVTNSEDSEMSITQDMWEPKDTINPFYYNGTYYTVHYDSLNDIFYIYE